MQNGVTPDTIAQYMWSTRVMALIQAGHEYPVSGDSLPR